MRRHARALFVVAALCSFFAVGAPAAFGAKTVVNTIGGASTGATGGLFNTPRGVAINTTGKGGVPIGTTYVVDASNARIQQFDPSGAFVRTWGWGVRDGAQEFQTCVVASECRAGISSSNAQPGQMSTAIVTIAVDPGSGAVYVADQTTSRRIHVFSATGVFEGAFGWGVASGEAKLQFCTSLTGCRTAAASAPASGVVPGGQFGLAIGGLAVDSSGNVYVANKGSRRVDVFKPTISAGIVTGIEHLRSFGWGVATGAAEFEVCTTSCRAAGTAGTGVGQFGTNSPSEVAVDSAGNVYALDFANKRIQQFSSVPAPITSEFGAAALSATFGTGNLHAIALDAASGKLLVAGSRSAAASQVAVQVLTNAGDPVETIGTELTPTTANGVAVGKYELGSDVVVSSSAGGHRVYVINDAPTVQAPTGLGPNSATFNGEVVSEESETKFRFEYSSDGGQTWQRTPATDALAGSGPGSLPVAQGVDGLVAGTDYLVRLVGIRPAGGSVTRSAAIDFTTPAGAPLIGGTFVSAVGPASARLAAYVNPNNEAASYYFEYGLTAAYGTQAPLPAGEIGSGSSQVTVSEQVQGLQSGTTYHFRVVAVNDTGTTPGLDVTFETLPTGTSPDGRAYEMVSPPNKSGYDVLVPGTQEYSTDVLPISSSDGNAVAFTSHSPFGDNVESNSVYSTYLARRSSSAWGTTMLTPPVDGSLATTSAFYQFYDDNLTKAYLVGPAAPQLVPGASELANNLYSRDLDTFGYDLLTPGAPEGVLASPSSMNPNFGGANAAGSEVVFEASSPGEMGGLPPSTAWQVFKWSAATQELKPLGLEPDTDMPFESARLATADVTGDVNTAPSTYRPVSDDASKVSFYAPTDANRQLYMWVEGDDSTHQASASRRTPPDPNGTKAPVFWVASRDGEKAFFTSSEKLTDDATTGAASLGNDLYLYEQATDTLTDIVVDPDDDGADVRGVLGASASGDRVYFVARGVLDDGAVAGADNLYLWIDDGTPKGQVRFVATGVAPANWGGDLAQPFDEEIFSRVTEDGETVVFQSTGSLTGYDTGGHYQVYVYDAGSDRLSCASCDPTGAPATADAIAAGTSNEVKRARIVTDDGRFAFFETTGALLPADVNERLDVYGFDTVRGELELISSGTGQFPSFFADSNADGTAVLFDTRQRLVGIDFDSNMDVYQARVGGGLAGQNPPPGPSPCNGESCRPPISSPPPPPSSSSSNLQGSGNVKEARRQSKKKKAKRRSNKKKGKKGKGKQKKRAKGNGKRGQGR